MVQTFRVLGWFEGISFLLLLFVAMPFKYILGFPEMVRALGPLHGGLFIVYVFLAFAVADELNWPWKVRLLALLAAVLPGGTFIFENKYLQEPRRI